MWTLPAPVMIFHFQLLRCQLPNPKVDKNQLTAYLEGNEEEINFYFQGEARLQGFQRDSDMAAVESRQNKIGDELVDDPSVERQRERIKQSVANRVNLLRAQVKTIQSDRKGAAAGWLATIDGMWKGLEFELLKMVPLDAQRHDKLINWCQESWQTSQTGH